MDIASLRPKTKPNVMELAKEAGLVVSDWGNFKGGPSKAASNPKYCYEWAFSDPGRLVIANIWYTALQQKDGDIFYHLDLSGTAPNASINPTTVARRRRMAFALEHAKSINLPIRVIICDGKRRSDDPLGKKASSVSGRLLDSEPWMVVESKDGKFILQRGLNASFSDQFDTADVGDNDPKKREITTQQFERDKSVRERVLKRSAGMCEYCRAPGFPTAAGSIYLETHHIIPLSEGGPDTDTNVIALCPNDHRKAHHGQDRDNMRKILTEKISSIHL
jgi:hypothetical protein